MDDSETNEFGVRRTRLGWFCAPLEALEWIFISAISTTAKEIPTIIVVVAVADFNHLGAQIDLFVVVAKDARAMVATMGVVILVIVLVLATTSKPNQSR
jgi:hypothetical protein